MLFFFSVFLMLFPTIAFSFPENIRHGYTSCGACHVSPSGGGVLTGYGKASAADFMSTWGEEGQGKFLHGALREQVEGNRWLVGGDVRYLWYQVYPKQASEPFQDNFLMQADVELAYRFLPNWYVAASGGVYGSPERRTQEFRRFYLLWNQSSNLSVRVGRFATNYGIFNPDHTINTRQQLELGQDSETYNLEVNLRTQKYEVFFTAIGGKDTQGTEEEFGWDDESDSGFALKGGWFFNPRLTAGLSYRYLALEGERYTTGPYLLWSFLPQWYVLGEFALDWFVDPFQDFVEAFDNNRTDYTYAKLGWEFYQGVHVFGEYQSREHIDSYSYTTLGGVQLFPIPHLELYAKTGRQYTLDSYTDLISLIVHYYF